MGTHGPSGASPAVRQRGVARVWDPRVWGTFVGAAGATVFVWSSRGDLASPWSVVAVVAWVLAAAAYVWFVLAVPRRFPAVPEVGAVAGLVYLLSVAGMLLLIWFGSWLLGGAGRPELRPTLIVVAVGLHFWPFARAFHAPVHTRLGTVMVVIGTLGLLVGWWVGVAAAVAAVVAGVAMLVLIAADAAAGTGGTAGSDSAWSVTRG